MIKPGNKDSYLVKMDDLSYNQSIGLINISILFALLYEGCTLQYILRLCKLKYFSMFIFCIFTSLICTFVYSGVSDLIVKEPLLLLFANISWILYTQTYLYFLIKIYEDILIPKHVYVCKILNFINLSSQISNTVFYFKAYPDQTINNLLLLIGENISATFTILSETLMIIFICNLILQDIKTSNDRSIILMYLKTLIALILMYCLDVVVIFLEYSGRELIAYFTKPLIISFKFLIELFVLSICKYRLVFYVRSINS